MAGQTTIEIKTTSTMQIVWGGLRTARGTFVAVCDALGLTVEADNETELHSLIAEAQHFLMVDLLEDGELPRFLSDRGWTANRPVPRKMPSGGVRFDVPYRVEVAHGHT